MRRFTRTVHAFILMVLEGTRGKQIDSEKALTAEHLDPNKKCLLNELSRKYFLLNIPCAVYPVMNFLYIT